MDAVRLFAIRVVAEIGEQRTTVAQRIAVGSIEEYNMREAFATLVYPCNRNVLTFATTFPTSANVKFQNANGIRFRDQRHIVFWILRVPFGDLFWICRADFFPV